MKSLNFHKKPVVIFQCAQSPTEYFLADTVYTASYARLASIAQSRAIDLRFVMGASSYSDGKFHSYGAYVGATFQLRQESFTAGMILLKSRTSLLDNEPRVNNPFLEQICRDKLCTYQTFPTLVKKTMLATSADIDQLSGDSLVVKPRYGSEGRKVELVNKQDIPSLDLSGEDFILQEVIDSSQGIPHLIDSRHELRLYVFNGKVHAAYLRIPAEGSFLSNVSQGARVKLLDTKDIPESIFSLADTVDALFTSIRPRLYTIDVMVENNQSWIVELNDMPGLPDVTVQPLADTFFNALLDLLTQTDSRK